ncbi:Methylthioribose-1-phosphate isomerase [Exidia glandulosa HHB12029]|uniref:Methylthioribose-1-phosphate isomerase n=1 Tax=Exidia glandulosa HHB12029 TaxID=1314781 RepID=A0A165E7C2_EXIGL|nr:Methylthioribose-1-phosphate isomerase [Exidia glandulosa HHB12029]
MAPLVSIRTTDSKIEIVDQLLLPHVVQYVEIASVHDAHSAIKTMRIRGAPAIASLASLAIGAHVEQALNYGSSSQPVEWMQSTDALRAHVVPLLDFLYTARPTAVNLGAAVARLRLVLDEPGDVHDVAKQFVKEAHAVADEDVGRNKEMSRHGAEWVLEQAGNPEGGVNVLTVCNTGSLATSGYGTALGVITHLYETGKLKRAYFTQSAPYHQGSRLTAMELIALGIPCTMICDTMVGSLFQTHDIHAVVVGADRIARNGDTANKIGTYNAAVLAKYHKIPFATIAPVSTVDLAIPDGTHIPIEHRPAVEATLARGAVYPRTEPVEQAVVQITPDGLGDDMIYNPSFDVTPAELISAVVTERGVHAIRQGFDMKNELQT